eukprot:jgi/Botrbrau1/3072/Bobra.0070s0063.2
MDEKVLSYHNAYLRVRDVILLQGRNWLNDQIITFYFEFLKTETFRALETCVAFVHPATSYLLEIAGAESLHLAEMLSPLKLNQCDYIFLPINDNVDYTEAEGGSHWSLLVYSAREAVFRHYDSAGINHNWAVGTAKALQTVLASYDSQLESHLEGEDEDTGPNLHEGAGPRQENSWDCGIYVLRTVEELSGLIAAAGGVPLDWEAVDGVLKENVTAESAVALRSRMLELIDILSAE